MTPCGRAYSDSAAPGSAPGAIVSRLLIPNRPAIVLSAPGDTLAASVEPPMASTARLARASALQSWTPHRRT
jgi:hypothetical protein